MDDAAVGKRVDALLGRGRGRGERVQALADALGRSLSQTYRLLGGTSEWSEELVARAAKFAGVDAAMLRYGAENAPAGTEPAGAVGRTADELRDPVYWAGRQDASFALMENVARLMNVVVSMHGQAMQAQREIMSNTRPVPVTSGPPELPPRDYSHEPDAHGPQVPGEEAPTRRRRA